MNSKATIGVGYTDRCLSKGEARDILAQAFAEHDMTGKRVLLITPDATRSAPMPMMFRLFYEALADKVAALDYLIALGTHMAMDDEQLNALFGLTAEERAQYSKVNIFNHEWENPETFVQIGVISAGEIEQITDGLMSMVQELTTIVGGNAASNNGASSRIETPRARAQAPTQERHVAENVHNRLAGLHDGNGGTDSRRETVTTGANRVAAAPEKVVPLDDSELNDF